MSMTDPFLPGDPDAGADAGTTLPGDDGLAGGDQQLPDEQAAEGDAALGPVEAEQQLPGEGPDAGTAHLA